jgi:glycosyltransferase involved in cell wall biosynthesis
MKKHILIFIPAIESGGVEKNAAIVANELAAQDYPVSVLFCRIIDEKRAAFSNRVEMVQFPRTTIPLVNPRLTDAYFMKKNLSAYLDQQDAENTVLIAFQSASVAIGVCRKAGVRVICRLSNHPSTIKYEKSLLRKCSEWLRPYTYKKADVIVANSKKLADDFGRKTGREVVTIYNPVDFPEVARKMDEEIEEELRGEAKRYQGRLLVAVGRLTFQKDYDTLLRGFALSKHKDTMLWIIGEGSERAHLERLTAELGIGNRVRLLGYRNNVYKYLKYGTIYVLSSRYEGCPNSLIEAVAVGLPCIAADCLSGPREVLLDGEGGLLFPVGDSHALAARVDEYLQHAELRKQKCAAAMQAVNRFEIEKTIDAYKKIL